MSYKSTLALKQTNMRLRPAHCHWLIRNDLVTSWGWRYHDYLLHYRNHCHCYRVLLTACSMVRHYMGCGKQIPLDRCTAERWTERWWRLCQCACRCWIPCRFRFRYGKDWPKIITMLSLFVPTNQYLSPGWTDWSNWTRRHHGDRHDDEYRFVYWLVLINVVLKV